MTIHGSVISDNDGGGLLGSGSNNQRWTITDTTISGNFGAVTGGFSARGEISIFFAGRLTWQREGRSVARAAGEDHVELFVDDQMNAIATCLRRATACFAKQMDSHLLSVTTFWSFVREFSPHAAHADRTGNV
ncbi:MAG: hypothetical protein IH987_09785 [Planctomycetes bacterium]|nr:hypothetical protein [Planctomycetota bacterium]